MDVLVQAAIRARLAQPEEKPVTEVQRTAPEVVYLQVSDEKWHEEKAFPTNHDGVSWCDHSVIACEAKYIRADLAAPLQKSTQKPMAWVVSRAMCEKELVWDKPKKPNDYLQITPLYTAPQPAAQTVPLTHEQIYAIGKKLGMKCRPGTLSEAIVSFARAIEAAHNIK